MKIHEYQAKDILRKYGVPVPNGVMVESLEEADRAAKDLFDAGNPVVVVKAQIHHIVTAQKSRCSPRKLLASLKAHCQTAWLVPGEQLDHAAKHAFEHQGILARL